MGPQSSAYHQILSFPPEMAGVVLRKQPGLRRDDSSDARDSDDSSVKVSGHGQIRAPAGIDRKIDRIMRDQNIILLFIRLPQDQLQFFLLKLLPGEFPVIRFRQLKTVNLCPESLRFKDAFSFSSRITPQSLSAFAYSAYTFP